MRSVRRHWLLVLFLGFTPATGCATWQGTEIQPGVTPDITKPFAVRVTRADGSVIELREVRLTSDSLFGTHGNPPFRVALSRSDVRRIDQPRLSGERTAVFVFVTVALVVAIWWVVKSLLFPYT